MTRPPVTSTSTRELRRQSRPFHLGSPSASYVESSNPGAAAEYGGFTGAVFAAQTYFQFNKIGMGSATGAVVSVAICRELAPVLSAFTALVAFAFLAFPLLAAAEEPGLSEALRDPEVKKKLENLSAEVAVAASPL